jgi:hypothetical protein
MARLFVAFLVAVSLCSFGSVAFAQDSQPSAPADSPIVAPHKAHARNGDHKSVAAQRTAQPNSDEADKAARLAEGRKKFFEQSMGFENGRSSPVTLGGENGFAPTMGLQF